MDDLEMLARSRGFHSYAEMKAFMQNRSVQNGPTPVVRQPSPTQAPTPPPTESAFSRLMSAWSRAVQ